MTVYVESNFVLEQSLQQEECDSCAEIIDLASEGRITLVAPAFSLAEPHVAILGKEKLGLGSATICELSFPTSVGRNHIVPFRKPSKRWPRF